MLRRLWVVDFLCDALLNVGYLVVSSAVAIGTKC